jgi:hypothetical protein
MKIEKSRRVVESRPVCMDLYLRIRMEFFKFCEMEIATHRF